MGATKEEAVKEAREIIELISQLKDEEVIAAKGYISALVDIQELKNKKVAV